MNERIKELAEQAGAEPTPFSNVLALVGNDIEKFAELILMDVLDICEELGDKGQDGHYCVDKIRRVFGV